MTSLTDRRDIPVPSGSGRKLCALCRIALSMSYICDILIMQQSASVVRRDKCMSEAVEGFVVTGGINH